MPTVRLLSRRDSKRFYLGFGVLLACVLAAPLLSQNFAPPPAKTPDDATLKAIAAKTEELGKLVTALRRQNVLDPVLAEVEVYHKAAVWIVKHKEFYQPTYAAWTLDVLDRGLLRASQAAQGKSPWLHQSGVDTVRAYRSRIDNSVQPYAVTLPTDYGKNATRKWRMDVVLHGRDSSLTEVKFLHQHSGDRLAPKDQDFVRIDIFGRVNNAYRWAGEVDVLEAIESFLEVERLLNRGQFIDPTRFVLRGFSMGGAGTWHLGLHRPDKWCVIGPGAGFTTTHGYIKDLPEKLPPYQEACLRIYDAVDYAENAFNVPVVSYGGSKDPQLAASLNIQNKLKTLKIPMTLLIAPDLAHNFPPEWQKKAEAEYAKYAGEGKGRKEFPDRIQFVTYTLRYPMCDWVEILAMDQHYQQARVEAEKTANGFTVKTANVRTLRLALQAADPAPLDIRIDGQTIQSRPYVNQAGALNVYLDRKQGQWHSVLPQKLLVERLRQLQKIVGLQGPIDDAFMDAFLCVRGTGKPWHEATQKYADANLKRFQQEWDQFLRGELPVKDDIDVKEEDLANKHLILFGDPASNSLIAQVLDALPLKWTKDSIVLGGKLATASDHVPVMIFPSPLQSGRYVVLNSGHTFHAPEFRGTDAQLYPRLGDYALLKLTPTEKDPLATEVVTAGIFDDFWRMKKEEPLKNGR